jgi:hypothetical protein
MADSGDLERVISADDHAGDENPLQRWSRRKRAARQKQAPVASREAPPSLATEASEAPAESARSKLSDADMPPLESLGENSDYSGFFSARVSEELRRLALRKLFHLPAFNVRDGLDDYDEDFTQFAKLGNVITHEMQRGLQLASRQFEQAGDHATAAPPKQANVSDAEPAEEVSGEAETSACEGSENTGMRADEGAA